MQGLASSLSTTPELLRVPLLASLHPVGPWLGLGLPLAGCCSHIRKRDVPGPDRSDLPLKCALEHGRGPCSSRSRREVRNVLRAMLSSLQSRWPKEAWKGVKRTLWMHERELVATSWCHLSNQPSAAVRTFIRQGTSRQDSVHDCHDTTRNEPSLVSSSPRLTIPSEPRLQALPRSGQAYDIDQSTASSGFGHAQPSKSVSLLYPGRKLARSRVREAVKRLRASMEWGWGGGQFEQTRMPSLWCPWTYETSKTGKATAPKLPSHR